LKNSNKRTGNKLGFPRNLQISYGYKFLPASQEGKKATNSAPQISNKIMQGFPLIHKIAAITLLVEMPIRKEFLLEHRCKTSNE